ncbi:ChaN family lipoprotein [Nemorincola caseinilytica]|uniref:ChaN family lipoprotein n=1 Tax=Nemorincola caseinilytica TaxID=2054315 RepID=A0ABP8NSL6_9BACT
MKKIFLSLLALPFFASAQKLDENNYRIYSVKQGKEVTLKEMVSDMDNYDVMLFGEEHNDSVTHFLEFSVFELMHLKYGSDLALSLEMFDRDVQPVMDEYLQGFIKEKYFKKDARAWNNYRDYKPMVDFARQKKLDVVCANAPSRYTNLAGRGGQGILKELPDDAKKYIAPLPYDTATGPYHAKLTLVTHMPATTADTTAKKGRPFNMITAQSLWDATMAYSVTGYLDQKKNKGKKIMHVNGKFHSDEGYAVATQMGKYNSKLRKLIISAASDESFPKVNWETLKPNGDYIIVTDPKVPKTYSE